MSCVTRCIFRWGLISTLALGGATLLIGPERVTAGLAHVRAKAQSVVDGAMDNPVALRRRGSAEGLWQRLLRRALSLHELDSTDHRSLGSGPGRRGGPAIMSCVARQKKPGDAGLGLGSQGKKPLLILASDRQFGRCIDPHLHSPPITAEKGNFDRSLGEQILEGQASVHTIC